MMRTITIILLSAWAILMPGCTKNKSERLHVFGKIVDSAYTPVDTTKFVIFTHRMLQKGLSTNVEDIPFTFSTDTGGMFSTDIVVPQGAGIYLIYAGENFESEPLYSYGSLAGKKELDAGVIVARER